MGSKHLFPESGSRNVLVAPLNWGLGHATRCIPVIRELLRHGYQPIIASDGQALALLQKEFPELKYITLPSYNIRYAENPMFFSFKMLTQVFHIIKTAAKERKRLKKLVKKYKLIGVISDNRFGLYHKKTCCIYISHQLHIQGGGGGWLAGFMHRCVIRRFSECWVPDYEGRPNLSGRLGHVARPGFPMVYVGPLSRFKEEDAPQRYDVMVLLSGPEPQRTLLEDRLFEELSAYPGRILFVRGLVSEEQTVEERGPFLIYNFMLSEQLQRALAESGFVVCRSGYSSIMDLAVMRKKAFFIPTPGQPEQGYLARKMDSENAAPYAVQKRFRMGNLAKAALYRGLPYKEPEVDWEYLLSLFEGKRKLGPDA